MTKRTTTCHGNGVPGNITQNGNQEDQEQDNGEGGRKSAASEHTGQTPISEQSEVGRCLEAESETEEQKEEEEGKSGESEEEDQREQKKPIRILTQPTQQPREDQEPTTP